MKKIVTTLGIVAALALVTSAALASTVRISQVYGGGGGSNTSATYNQDYVEIFNSTNAPVDISGWYLEYGSATGNWGSSTGNYFALPAGTIIQPCSYLLFACGTIGTGGAALPVTADFSTTLNISSSSGKVALFNALNSNLVCGSEIAGTLEDKVAFGTSNCAEGTAAGGVSVSTAAVRGNGGLDETDNNSVDFSIVPTPVPSNSSSPANPLCSATPSMQGTWGALKSIYR